MPIPLSPDYLSWYKWTSASDKPHQRNNYIAGDKSISPLWHASLPSPAKVEGGRVFPCEFLSLSGWCTTYIYLATNREDKSCLTTPSNDKSIISVDLIYWTILVQRVSATYHSRNINTKYNLQDLCTCFVHALHVFRTMNETVHLWAMWYLRMLWSGGPGPGLPHHNSRLTSSSNYMFSKISWNIDGMLS